MKVSTFKVENKKIGTTFEYDYIDEIIMDEIYDGVRYISKFSERSVLSEEVIYHFTIGMSRDIVKDYSGNKKFAVSYEGYGNSGWYDSDEIDELLLHLVRFYQSEGIIKKYTHKYTVCIKQDGSELADCLTLRSAIKEVSRNYEEDMKNDCYEDDYYDIKRIDCCSTRFYSDIGTFLTEYNESHSMEDFINFKILPSQKDLADYLNVTPGAVSQYDKTKKELMLLGLWAKKEFGRYFPADFRTQA